MNTMNHKVRPLTAEELDAVAGGAMETVFQYGGTRIEITAAVGELMVCVFREGQPGGCKISRP